MTISFSIFLIISLLIVFLLFLALITNRQYSITREVIINKPVQEVFDYIKLVKNQEKYNVWVMKDPNVKIEYKGTDGTIGFISAWEGNKQAGKGEQEIKEISNAKSLELELRFEKPFKNIGYIYLQTEAISESETQLLWQMRGKNKFPLNLMNLIIDGMLGNDIEKNLANIKRILETH